MKGKPIYSRVFRIVGKILACRYFKVLKITFTGGRIPTVQWQIEFCLPWTELVSRRQKQNSTRFEDSRKLSQAGLPISHIASRHRTNVKDLEMLWGRLLILNNP